jgi:hypothetical protein
MHSLHEKLKLACELSGEPIYTAADAECAAAFPNDTRQILHGCWERILAGVVEAARRDTAASEQAGHLDEVEADIDAHVSALGDMPATEALLDLALSVAIAEPICAN